MIKKKPQLFDNFVETDNYLMLTLLIKNLNYVIENVVMLIFSNILSCNINLTC